ncbi:putative NAD(P)/FAD-binding protein YdhS [Mycetocola sp. BIGb0189]|uniref:FAD/NAD(P)-binding protein n=1 Tax=Mycetocola sp. BIGb0189 TaxID=2940604 RepID=UPI00216915BB|nr:FAD/NAD(P)-binding protein [Mycetocola sp. BIGb0189]MCS4275813.1 putative NAD(P)/FAD-binding protein YdhS [Mycetocola sp. BIGb0189]
MSVPTFSSQPAPAPSLVVLGAGPRAVGVLERLAANAAELWPAGTPLIVHLVDPHPAGPGRIWRYDQSPLLKLNSMAADVTMFTDETSVIEGPIRPGPSLVEWAERVRTGAIVLPGEEGDMDNALREELSGLGPASFPTRRVQSLYLRWFYTEAVRVLGPGVRVIEHRALALSVRETADGSRRVHLDNGEVLDADLVLYSLGHTGVKPEPEHARLHGFATTHGLFYLPPAFTADADTRALRPGENVLVRGFGLAAVDLIVLLTEGRGGRFERPLPGGPLRYVPSGREPRILVGSRRGVPYHSKIGSALAGEAPSPRFFTAEVAARLEAERDSLDFADDVWPLIAKEMLWGYYRELFTGHPERVNATWGTFSRAFEPIDPRAVLIATAAGEPVTVGPGTTPADSAPSVTARSDTTSTTRPDASVSAGSQGYPLPRIRDDRDRAAVEADARALSALIEASVPDPLDRLFLPELDRPLAGTQFDRVEDLQRAVRSYIEDDLRLRTRPEHSATLGLFLSILGSMFTFAELVASPKWTARSRVADINGWWQGYFSFIASGPPAHRLEELLALSAAGIVDFLGGDIRVDINEKTGEFRARGANHDRTVSARALVDARLPDANIARSDSALLRSLIDTGDGVEEIARDPHTSGRTELTAPTGKLTVRPEDRRVVHIGGDPAPRSFAIGPYTNSPFVGAFSRPRTNAVSFRENDRVARALLIRLAEITEHRVASDTAVPTPSDVSNSRASAPDVRDRTAQEFLAEAR